MNVARRASWLVRATWLWCAGYCAVANAQPARLGSHVDSHIEDILPLANDPNDPIGLDREQGELDRADVHDNKPVARPARSAAEVQRFGPEPPALPVRVGEVLTAIPNVQERSHGVSVELQAGLSLIKSELRFESTSPHPAELQYRLAVPDDAALISLSVEVDAAARNGVFASEAAARDAYDDCVMARGPGGLPSKQPVAQARKLHDARGSALLLTAAPVVLGHPLVLRVSYLVATPQRGSVVRLHLPARGMDPRVAPLLLRVQAPTLELVAVGERPASSDGNPFDPWVAVDVQGRAREHSPLVRQLLRFDCGSARCMRAYVRAGPAEPNALDLVLAIDASPSMEGPARTRLLSAIAAVLSQAPKGSKVRALLFASQAVPLVREALAASAVPLQSFSAASYEAELGSATRFEAAWQLIESWGAWPAHGLHRSVVVIGDGGLTTGPARAFAAARRAGVEISVVNVSDRACTPALAAGVALTRGQVIEAGQQAELATHQQDSNALEERVASLFAPIAVTQLRVSDGRHALQLPSLRAGEELAYEAVVRGTPSLHVDGRAAISSTPAHELGVGLALRAAEQLWAPVTRVALAAIDERDLTRAGEGRPAAQPATKNVAANCDRRGPAERYSGQSSDAQALALATERASCAQPAKKPAPTASEAEDAASPGAGMPSSPLLSMLRQRILPIARGCFRRDRAGRPDYQVRAVFEFRLAEREVVSAEVTGKIAQELRECLLAAVDSLAVPRFSGSVVVRYPLVTEKEALPSEIELTPNAAERLDSVLHSQ